MLSLAPTVSSSLVLSLSLGTEYPVAYRRWRVINNDAPGSSNFVWWKELFINQEESMVLTQVALDGTNGVASSNSVYNSGYSPSGAFNGSTSGNGWSSKSNPGPGVWLEFNFDEPYAPKYMTIVSNPGTGYITNSISVQYHDGFVWNTWKTFTINDEDWDAAGVPLDLLRDAPSMNIEILDMSSMAITGGPVGGIAIVDLQTTVIYGGHELTVSDLSAGITYQEEA